MTRKRSRAPRPVEAAASAAPPHVAVPWIVFGIALALRLLHVWQMRDTPFFATLMGDARGYDRWAQEIAGGDWMGRDVFYQAPLYPYFLGALYRMFGRDLLIVRVVQAVIGAAGCAALAAAGQRWLTPAAGAVAGLMLALYPPAIFFDGLIQKAVLDVFFVCVSLALIAHLDRGGARAIWWVGLGLTLGALSLTRENALVLVVLVLGWAAWSGPRAMRVAASQRSGLQAVALVLLGLAVVLGPVALRNYRVGGGFYLTTSQFGSNLFIGNNPRADGSYVSLRAGRGSPDYERLDARTLAEQASGRPLTPGEVSSYWAGRTFGYIAEQPGDWMRLLARKARLLISREEIIDTESQESHSEYSWVLAVLGPIWHAGVVLPLAAAGAVVLWPQRRRLWLLFAVAAAYALSVVAFFVVARYRHPLLPFACLFAAAGSVALYTALARRTLHDLRGAVAVAMVVAVASNWPLSTPGSPQAITENNLGTALQEDGRPAEAIDRYKRALAFDPEYLPALNNLGTALRAAGRVDEAVGVFGQALARDGDAASVRYNLGNALMARGDAAGAVKEFEAALAADPRSVEAANNLGQALAAIGDSDRAIEAFRRALTIDDASLIAHRNLANALASKGQAREAATHFERAIILAPADAAIRYDYGSLLLEVGAFEGAATTLREAIRLKSDYAEAHNNLGIALASQGRLADAIVQWREAVRLRPDFADAQTNLRKATMPP
jgi:tetratricopeptide (TPR) repeat protein